MPKRRLKLYNNSYITSVLGPEICAELIAQAYEDIPVYYPNAVNGVRAAVGTNRSDALRPGTAHNTEARLSHPVSRVNSRTGSNRQITSVGAAGLAG